MIGFMWAAVGVLAGFGLAAIGDMVSEEVRDRLDHLPHAILRLAARWLDPAQRAPVYQDEWMPELTYILKGDEARPVTRLIHGLRYSVSMLVHMRRIARNLEPSVPVRSYVINPEAFLAILIRQREQEEEQITQLRGYISAAQTFATDPSAPDQDRIDAQMAVTRLQEKLASLTRSQASLTNMISQQHVNGLEVYVKRTGRRTRLRIRAPR